MSITSKNFFARILINHLRFVKSFKGFSD